MCYSIFNFLQYLIICKLSTLNKLVNKINKIKKIKGIWNNIRTAYSYLKSVSINSAFQIRVNKGTVTQIEKVLINDRLRVSRVP